MNLGTQVGTLCFSSIKTATDSASSQTYTSSQTHQALPICLNKTQPVSDFHSEISGSRPRNSRSLSLWNGSGMSPLPLFNNGIKLLGKRFRAPVWALCQYLFRMKVTKGRLSLPETAKCKEQIRCGNSVALLSEESIMVQTVPTVQHELHSCILLCLFNKCLPLLLQSPWSLQCRRKNYSL